ncbi:putative hydrolase of the HAD superfamily [Kushneria sinocarnis]|uniref:Putative hydrolase of the HAD superfamily n=1 Tax=Kushneria sinocarnis TaxID=595502 RepID=A0A420WVX9_9GAMM|nr:HAD family phosphatase [Kushneria sinocarnis]RKR03242.1 putative hydrolase of the HAD superfamily [Kushneria sinocarnis]
MTPQVLLFDVGGVLADWDGTTPLVELTEGRLDRDQARRFWLEFKPLVPFETGRASVHEFTGPAVEALGLDMSREEFAARFDSWMAGPYEGAMALLERIRPDFVRGVLSNNNSMHWARFLEQSRIDRYVEHVFVSHQTGLRKPDRAAYEHVIDALGQPAEAFHFFDDNPECVEAARSFGMQATRVRGVGELEAALAAEGYLKESAMH